MSANDQSMRATEWTMGPRVSPGGGTARGVEALTNGAARIDRSRTSVGNYLRFGKYRMGASFALFGTNTVNGTAHTLWCIGNMEVVHGASGPARVNANLTCPVS